MRFLHLARGSRSEDGDARTLWLLLGGLGAYRTSGGPVYRPYSLVSMRELIQSQLVGR